MRKGRKIYNYNLLPGNRSLLYNVGIKHDGSMRAGFKIISHRR